MCLVRQVTDTIDRYALLQSGGMVVVGVSGGPDSLCLLHVLRRLAEPYGIALHVGHLNHMIRGADADEDASYVAALCCSWDVPCTVTRFDVPAFGKMHRLAIEEAARQARYRFLGSLARTLGSLSVAVGHNADDQVETVLMHFLRGSGLAGLRGMRPLSWVDALRLGETIDPAPVPQERLRLLRPLLDVSRRDIEDYCETQGLNPRFDRSNLDTTYFRNRLRHELVPILEAYNPSIRRVVCRTADVLSADHEVLRGVLCDTWPQVVLAESEDAIAFDRGRLRALPLALQRSVLREAIHRLRFSLRNINWVHIHSAVDLVRGGMVGSRATLPGGLSLTIGYDRVTLALGTYAPPEQDRPHIQSPMDLRLLGISDLPGGSWQVEVSALERRELPEIWDENPDPNLAYIDRDAVGSELVVRPRRTGEWFMPLGLGHRQKLSDFMINAKVPRRERANVPILVSGQSVVWVVGWRLDGRFAVKPETDSVLRVRFRRCRGKQ